MRICSPVVLSSSKITIILSELIDRPSSWYQLQKPVAWLLRFKRYLHTRLGRIQMPLCCGPLKEEEISCAPEEIIKLVQKDSGLDFIDKQMPHRTTKLSPIVYKGVVRVGGRLDNAPLECRAEASSHFASRPSCPETYCAPLLHPGRPCRNKSNPCCHPSTVLKRIVSECIPCCRRNQHPSKQIVAPLLAARVTPGVPPFSSVGIDYFGPLKVKWRRGTAKRYGCIFTCLVMRAIHIEISHD